MMELTVKGIVPDISSEELEEIAKKGEANCQYQTLSETMLKSG
jgi:hypothetical protein